MPPVIAYAILSGLRLYRFHNHEDLRSGWRVGTKLERGHPRLAFLEDGWGVNPCGALSPNEFSERDWHELPTELADQLTPALLGRLLEG